VSARASLKRAQAAAAKAVAALEAARHASTKGRTFLAEVVSEFERHAAIDKRISTSRTSRVKEAIKSGVAPVFAPDGDLSASAVARAELDNRRVAAEQVVAELVAEEREAERVASASKVALDDAIKAVMREEAERIAERAEHHAAEALRERVKLGGLYGNIDQMPGLSAAVIRSVRANAEVTWNSPEYHALSASGIVWSMLEGALAHDSNAQPAFDL
jgi:hypothetical protein